MGRIAILGLGVFAFASIALQKWIVVTIIVVVIILRITPSA